MKTLNWRTVFSRLFSPSFLLFSFTISIVPVGKKKLVSASRKTEENRKRNVRRNSQVGKLRCSQPRCRRPRFRITVRIWEIEEGGGITKIKRFIFGRIKSDLLIDMLEEPTVLIWTGQSFVINSLIRKLSQVVLTSEVVSRLCRNFYYSSLSNISDFLETRRRLRTECSYMFVARFRWTSYRFLSFSLSLSLFPFPSCLFKPHYLVQTRLPLTTMVKQIFVKDIH